MIFRWGLIVGVIAASVIGSIAERVPAAAPAVVPGGFILEAETHAHSLVAAAFPTPIDLPLLARHNQVDVLVVNEHNSTLGAFWARSFARAFVPSVIVIPAQEITRRTYHFSAIGVEQTIDYRLPIEEAARAARDQGAVVVANHPGGPAREPLRRLAELRLLDGVEIVHPFVATGGTMGPPHWQIGQFRSFWEEAGQISDSEVMPIGGSDYHGLHALGWLRTFVFAEAVSEQSVMDAFRAHRAFVIHPDGSWLGSTDAIEAARAGNFVPRAVSYDYAPRTIMARVSTLFIIGLLVLGFVRS